VELLHSTSGWRVAAAEKPSELWLKRYAQTGR